MYPLEFDVVLCSNLESTDAIKMFSAFLQDHASVDSGLKFSMQLYLFKNIDPVDFLSFFKLL